MNMFFRPKRLVNNVTGRANNAVPITIAPIGKVDNSSDGARATPIIEPANTTNDEQDIINDWQVAKIHTFLGKAFNIN